MSRVGPYTRYGMAPAPRLFMWCAGYKDTHPWKADQINADMYIASNRFAAVFDGVGSMPVPGSMSAEPRVG